MPKHKLITLQFHGHGTTTASRKHTKIQGALSAENQIMIKVSNNSHAS